MKIDLLDKTYIYGAVKAERTERGTFFHRMTADLEKFYKYSEHADIRAMNTSGVRIAFVTDSTSLRLSGSYGRVSREIYSFDVAVGGELITMKPDSAKPETFKLDTCLPGRGLRKIELFLPNMAETFITSLDIDDAAELMPLERPAKKWLFIGDSITQGMTVSSPALSYAARTAQAVGCDWHNIAVGGAVMKKEIGEMALSFEWDTASVAYGVNDFAQNVSLEDFACNTRGMLEALSSRSGAKIFIITPIVWVGRTEPNTLGLSLDDYRKVLADIASSFSGVTVIEGTGLVPCDEKYFVDKLHPNDEGMKEYSANLLRQL